MAQTAGSRGGCLDPCGSQEAAATIERIAMRIRSKLLLSALVAALVLSIGVGTAGANRSIEVSPAGALRGVSRALTFAAGFGEVICEVTLDGRLNARIAKTARASLGAVTAARIAIERCRGSFGVTSINSITALFSPTWDVQYVSFAGTLPNITSFLLENTNTQFLLDIGSILGTIRCLYRTNVRVRAPVVSGRVSRLEVLNGQRFRGTELAGGRCQEGELRGSFDLAVAQSVRLL